MRAVNLIPSDLRRAGGSPGASGNGVYILLGALGVALVLVATWAVFARSVANAENDLDRVKAEADVAEVRAGQLTAYTKFHEMRVKRVETVTSLSRSRFNWPFALREVSRVLPERVWLTQLTGTVAPGVQIEDGGGGQTAQLRSQISSPAFELVGCTVDQEQVARYLARLRSIQGVTRVTLVGTEKLDIDQGSKKSGGSGSGGAASDTDCRQGNIRIPKFELIVFFEGSTATPSSGGPPAAATQPAADTQGASK
jgi:Tfp pilus assembly protein PilN